MYIHRCLLAFLWVVSITACPHASLYVLVILLSCSCANMQVRDSEEQWRGTFLGTYGFQGQAFRARLFYNFAIVSVTGMGHILKIISSIACFWSYSLLIPVFLLVYSAIVIDHSEASTSSFVFANYRLSKYNALSLLACFASTTYPISSASCF